MYLHSIPLLKYPRTPHLEDSRLQSGDGASDQIALKALAGRYVVIEEKIDGTPTRDAGRFACVIRSGTLRRRNANESGVAVEAGIPLAGEEPELEDSV
ncbi:hypothetical protein Pcaca05_31640 [Pectobacterium carotovorum subsp. carotovorum]|nr:hypothetical protein Pcaca05_31640 [Pectobacterium carotovorum subsp. carotovorum]